MKGINICRPFVLCNDFIPPTSNKDYKWKNLAWGYFDGIEIGENLFKNTKDKFELEKLDDFYQEQSEQLEGSYSTQIIYGIRIEIEEEDKQITDLDFWEDENNQRDFPFIFITLIQADKNIDLLSETWNKQSEFEKILNEIDENYKAITYLSLDNSDMILVIRSKFYSVGAKVIDEIHRNPESSLNKCFGWKTKYTFTIASASKEFVYNTSASNSKDEIVDTAYIYLIEREAGGVDYVYEKLKEVLLDAGMTKKQLEEQIKKKQSVLGYNDEVIELSGISWSVFLKLYCNNEEGILNHTNSVYKNNLNGVTTIIGLKQEIAQKQKRLDIKPNGQESSSPSGYLCSIMKKKCERMLKYLPEGQSVRSLKRSIYQIINSLQKFEWTPFSDYLFLPTALPLNMVLDMAEEMDSYRNNYIDLEDLFSYFYEFIKGLNMYVQNSNRSDRQFIQIPEFTIRIYDIPTKMTAFYNAYMFNLKNYLNKMVKYEEGKVIHEYEFLLCPGAANNLHIKEFFKKVSNTKRLFLVESPENILFNPVRMLIILTHELGHVVGTGVRMREERTKYAIKIMCKLVCHYMKIGIQQAIKKRENGNTDNSEVGNIKEWLYINNEEFWIKLEKNLQKDLSKYFAKKKTLKNGLRKDENEKNQLEYVKKYEEDRKDYSYVVEAELTGGISEILRQKDDLLWGYLLEKDYAYWLGKKPDEAKDKKIELREEIYQLISDMRNTPNIWSKTNAFNLSQSIRVVYNLFQECLADLLCILTLKLTIEDYIDMLLWHADYLYGELKPGMEIHLRCCLVTFCMQYPAQEISEDFQNMYRWNDKDLERLITEKEKFQFMKGIKKTLEIFLGDDDKRKEKYFFENHTALGMLYDSFIIEEITAYLLTCTREFFSYNNKDLGIQKEQEELQKTFRQFQKGNIKELAVHMQIYVEKHLNTLKEKHDKIIREEREYYGEGI